MTCVVSVDWHIKPEYTKAFAARAKRQTEDSLRLESECLYFDLCVLEDAPDRFFMYEIYTDRAAFDLHLASDHFKSFSEDIAEMVLSKELKTLLKV